MAFTAVVCVKESFGNVRPAAHYVQLLFQVKIEGGEAAMPVAQAVEREPDGELYCICRQPDDPSRDYVYCEECEQWYHPECLGTTLEVRDLCISGQPTQLAASSRSTKQHCVHVCCPDHVHQQPEVFVCIQMTG